MKLVLFILGGVTGSALATCIIEKKLARSIIMGLAFLAALVLLIIYGE